LFWPNPTGIHSVWCISPERLGHVI
jgi:hypothetical protein